MTAGDGKVAVPGKSPAVLPSLWSKDGTDGLGAVPSVLGKSRTAHRPRPSDGTVDITALSSLDTIELSWLAGDNHLGWLDVIDTGWFSADWR
ncbi:hypothetical protein BDD12DRAFT_845818 [Trichophaea hybrida]|nr:hypothetical protein BDD12DRAFT_845818 [Trichophaea hybrida]